MTTSRNGRRVLYWFASCRQVGGGRTFRAGIGHHVPCCGPDTLGNCYGPEVPGSNDRMHQLAVSAPNVTRTARSIPSSVVTGHAVIVTTQAFSDVSDQNHPFRGLRTRQRNLYLFAESGMARRRRSECLPPRPIKRTLRHVVGDRRMAVAETCFFIHPARQSALCTVAGPRAYSIDRQPRACGIERRWTWIWQVAPGYVLASLGTRQLQCLPT